MFYVSILVLVIGAIFRISAICSNKSFSLIPKVPYELCFSGLYRAVRHPAYVGTLLIVFGLSYLLAGCFQAILFTYLFFVILSDRARLEEQIILESFPAYAEYQKDTGFFFPKIIYDYKFSKRW